eukprot:5770379-Amphidinium_carterae.1
MCVVAGAVAVSTANSSELAVVHSPPSPASLTTSWIQCVMYLASAASPKAGDDRHEASLVDEDVDQMPLEKRSVLLSG